jgi:hypothetical protein
MGTQGYVEDGILNFLSGSYYVKLSSHRHGTEVRDALAEIARRVNEHLRQPVGWPKGLALLPETGRVPNSETFVAQNFLGYRCLDSAYVAEYDTAEHLRMFVIELATPADAHRVTETYLREIQHPRKSIDDGTFIVDDRHNGSVCIVLRGNRLGGIIGYSEKHRGFRRELEEVISDHPR